jgi:uncharacterized glyoxalase superfamily protein PhnB
LSGKPPEEADVPDLRPNIFPAFTYRDAGAAIEWLGDAFGFEPKDVHRDEEGIVQHAELRHGTGLIMLGQHREGGWRGERELDAAASPVSIYVTVDDPDALHRRAVAAGAEIIYGPVDQPYGSREFGALDLEGNAWSFGTYDPYAAG